MQHPISHKAPLIVMFSCTLALACATEPNAGLGISTDPVTPAEAPAGSPVAVHGQLRVEGTQLVDQAGTPVQLKGVSSMWLNWETQPFAEGRGALEYMRDAWKLSVIRAAMGVDNGSGYLSGGRDSMVKKLETIIQNANRVGVYVLVDWHTEKAVEQQDKAVEFFGGLARKYGAFPNVIWETYNEPVGYSWSQIRAYHEAVVDAIRAEDPDNIVVLGTPTWSQDVDVAAQSPAQPSAGAANLMYTLHFYSCTHQQKLRDKGTTAIGKGLPLFVTEFGATPSDGGTLERPYVCRDDANLWFAWMAQNNISGVAWKLDQCSDTSCILANNAPIDGPWTDDHLSSDVNNTPMSGGVSQGGGHGLFVVDWIRQ